MKRKNAYTLVEVMVGVLFISIALVTMASAFTNASHILQKSRHILVASGYLQDYAERTRNLSFSSVASSTPTIPSALSALLVSPSLSITVETVATDLKKVSLQISWNEAGTTVTKRTATLVTNGGINP